MREQPCFTGAWLRAFEEAPHREDLRLLEDLPIVIEIVDSEAKIREFLPILDGMIGSGLVILGKVQVLAYGETKIEDSRA